MALASARRLSASALRLVASSRSRMRRPGPLARRVNRYLDEANHDPKPFLWTARPDKIIAAVNRGRQALESIH